VTHGLSMEDGSVDHSAEAWRDSEARRSAKGGKAGERQHASKDFKVTSVSNALRGSK
jgi:hypothetical protein